MARSLLGLTPIAVPEAFGVGRVGDGAGFVAVIPGRRSPARLRAVGRASGPPVLWHAFCLLAWVLFFAATAVVAGPDATWDLRNYHLYAPFALFEGRLEFDLAPAQLQTYLSPTLDLPGHWLRTRLNAHPDLLDALLSLPHGIGAYLATLIALRFVPAGSSWRWPAAMALAAVGATGAAGFTTVATSQSEMVPGCFILGGVLLLLRCFEAGPTRRVLIAAGLLFGAAAGLKLTGAPYCLAAAAAVALGWPGSAREKLAAVSLFGLAVLGGTLLLAGWWWWRLYELYGSPLFPLYNSVFQSPHAPPFNATDERFKPKGLVQALFYPFYWGFGWSHPVTEPTMRDPRFALAYVAFGVAVVRHMLRPPLLGDVTGRQTGVLLAFFGVSYVAWQAQFSILRYLAPLEMLCGIVICLPLRALAGVRWGRPAAGAAAVLVCVSLMALTFYPDWGRAQPRDKAVVVDVPPLDARGLVVLLDASPMGYLAAFVPRSVRVVGANHWLVHPGRSGLLQERVDRLIETHPGPIYGMENPRDLPGMADRTLAHYRLRRGERCDRVRSNLDRDGVVVCPLVKDGAPPTQP